ncbi:MAG: hypothetical protein HYS44_03775, partial [Candidatus Niyogibacteria bacterium]|nr:hypothetical protein [Candidatus Niyogibacteria bacterium]
MNREKKTLLNQTGKGVLLWALSLAAFGIIGGAAFVFHALAAAGVPTIISYQGRLADADGDLLGGAGTTFYFTFSIWDNATVGSGSRVWPVSTPGTTTATVRQGVFNVNIGDVANSYPDLLDYDFSRNSDVYLQVTVSSDNDASQTLTPRQRISAAAFARIASAVSGSTTPSSFGTTTPIVNSIVTIEATSTNAIPLSIRAAAGQVGTVFQIQNSAAANILVIDASGRVGIATSSSAKPLTVEGDAFITGTAKVGNLVATGTTQFNGQTYTWPSSITASNFLKVASDGTLTWASASSGGGSGGGWDVISTDGGFNRLSTTTNRVGIGSTTPYAKLSVQNDSGIATTTFALQPISGQVANIIDIYNTSGALTSTLDVNHLLTIGGGIISNASSSIQRLQVAGA